MKLEFVITKNTTIKEFIYTNISRNFYGYLKERNAVFYIDGNMKKAYEEVFANQTLLIEYEEINEQVGSYSELPLDIIYEDNEYIVVDKKMGLQSIPSKANPYDSVFNRLLYYFKDTNNTVNIVNRLDKDTSGLMLIAKSNYARIILDDFNKVYYATTDKPLNTNKGTIDLAIARSDEGIKRNVDLVNGQKAITNYELIESKDDLYTYKIILETGRTHQIRVHFSYLNSPLINDNLYGGSKIDDKVMGLVCKSISFTNKITKVKIELESKIKV